eukprot:scaffold79541_cov14-Tisochrysis_lutea.AAC.1
MGPVRTAGACLQAGLQVRLSYRLGSGHLDELQGGSVDSGCVDTILKLQAQVSRGRDGSTSGGGHTHARPCVHLHFGGICLYS